MHYNHAPIVEAIIDLRAAPGTEIDIATLSALADSLERDLPSRQYILSLTMGFQKTVVAADAEFNSAQQRVGIRLDSANKQRVLQLKIDGMTYSHLAPYSDWETFREEAKAFWVAYVEGTKLERVGRIAVRVINKLPVTGTLAVVPTYSNLRLKLPDDLDQAQETFFTQFLLNGARWADGCHAVVNAGAVPQPEGRLELLWDFDIFVDSAKSAASAEIWEILNQLSVGKDELFEACITDSTRELIR